MSERRALPHAIRRPAIPHATTILSAVSGDELSRTRRAVRHAIRRQIISHATTILDAVSGDGRYRTRRARRHAIRRRAIPAATGLMVRDPATGAPARNELLVFDDA